MPWGVLTLKGVVFPTEEETTTSSTLTVDPTIVEPSSHYIMFELPAHNVAGLLFSAVEMQDDFVVQIARDILQAVAAMHQEGIVHRNVSLQNVFLVGRRAKVGGFYFSRSMPLKQKRFSLSRSEMEEHERGLLPNTAPELLLGSRSYTPACDMWSVGCCIITLFLRRVLFHGNDPAGWIYNIFKVVGTPTSTNWPQGKTLRHYKKRKPHREYTNNLIKALSEKQSEVIHPQLLEVLQAILKLNPNERMSAQQVLELPFFTNSLKVSATPPSLEKSYFEDQTMVPDSLRHQALRCSLISKKRDSDSSETSGSEAKRRG